MAKVRKSKCGKYFFADLRSIGGAQPRFKSAAEAQAAVEQAIGQQQQGGYINPKKSATFAQACGDDNSGFIAYQISRLWQETKGIGDGELDNSRNNIRHLIALDFEGKKLGDTKLVDIKAGKIELKIIPALLKGRAHKTAKNIFVTFKHVLSHAVLDDLLFASPCAEVKFPKGPEKDIKRLSRALISKIIEHARTPLDALKIRFTSCTGLRGGEFVALRWTAIDLDEKTVTVSEARKKKGKGKAIKLGSTKTRKGQRVVYLTEDLVAELRAWKLAQPIEQRANDLVFPNQAGNMDSVDNLRNRVLHSACKRAEVENISWQTLRHFYASILLFDMNESDATITQMMGHSSIDFMKRQYGHWLDDRERDKKLAGRVNTAFQL